MRCLLLNFIAAALTGTATHAATAAVSQTLLGRLTTLVEINSGSNNSGGVESIQIWITTELKALGFAVEQSADRLVIGTLRGRSPRVITLIVHADTVFEPSSPFRHLVVDGDVATGPGVIDDKGGIVVAFEGLRRYLERGPPEYTLRFVSSPGEEVGSPGLTDRFRELAKDTWLTLGFEPALDDGSVIGGRRGDRWYEVTVLGKEAHAGRAHRAGVNACVALADLIAAASKLTDYKRDVTVSVGHLSGGQDKFNIVCGKARAKIDARFATLADRDALHARLEQLIKQPAVAGARASFKLADDCPPFSPNASDRGLIDGYLKAIRGVEGTRVGAGRSGGSADSNYFARPGAVVIDGLGPVGGGMHTPAEFLKIPTLETRAEALNQFLRNLPTK